MADTKIKNLLTADTNCVQTVDTLNRYCTIRSNSYGWVQHACCACCVGSRLNRFLIRIRSLEYLSSGEKRAKTKKLKFVNTVLKKNCTLCNKSKYIAYSPGCAPNVGLPTGSTF